QVRAYWLTSFRCNISPAPRSTLSTISLAPPSKSTIPMRPPRAAAARAFPSDASSSALLALPADRGRKMAAIVLPALPDPPSSLTPRVSSQRESPPACAIDRLAALSLRFSQLRLSRWRLDRLLQCRSHAAPNGAPNGAP